MTFILPGAVAIAAALTLSTAPASASGMKTVYGWAKISGDSHFVLTPAKAEVGEIGESGLSGWSLTKGKGKPVRIAYTEGLDFRQINKTCGKRAAGYPHDTYSKKGFGRTKCDPIHLYELLRKGKLAVRVTYDATARPMSTRVWELNLP
ncbi:hypothetical protein [Nonomuraea longicatena]|uniref:Uncharacterized protein n=1 Tax=Nonomuraea longicatena TaxID=83682 RepID=A0ABN1P1F8_9ACTN